MRISFSTAVTPETARAIWAALSDSFLVAAVPVKLTTPLVVLTLIWVELMSLSAIKSDFTLVVIHESSTYAPVFCPELAQPTKPAIKTTRTIQLRRNAFFIVHSY